MAGPFASELQTLRGLKGCFVWLEGCVWVIRFIIDFIGLSVYDGKVRKTLRGARWKRDARSNRY